MTTKPKTAYTPQPLFVETDPGNGDRVVIDEAGLVVCRRANYADALLHAAAPDLLEAAKRQLRDALATIEDIEAERITGESAEALLDNARIAENCARAAIAKAEGE